LHRLVSSVKEQTCIVHLVSASYMVSAPLYLQLALVILHQVEVLWLLTLYENLMVPFFYKCMFLSHNSACLVFSWW